MRERGHKLIGVRLDFNGQEYGFHPEQVFEGMPPGATPKLVLLALEVTHEDETRESALGIFRSYHSDPITVLRLDGSVMENVYSYVRVPAELCVKVALGEQA